MAPQGNSKNMEKMSMEFACSGYLPKLSGII